MKILSVRLKNIKSYGSGADGSGTLISFERGVNRIAGKNGHGKTTLIESIGYALFLTNPPFEENFRMGTYFTRNGSGDGEIDVTFQLDGEVYRIERGVGAQSRRKHKVIQLSDDSICAEGSAEVADFLCRLLKFPSPERFSELFSKLIGVRQGRLTWPFDSKPSVAKAFFEPLLEVEIFRRCFDDLRPALHELKSQQQDGEVRLAGIQAKIDDRADSPAYLKECGTRNRKLTAALEEARKLHREARDRKEALERQEKRIHSAEKERDTAKNEFETSRQRREVAESQLEESRTARETVGKVGPAHEIFVKAEANLGDLRKRQQTQRELEDLRSKKVIRRTELLANAKGAADQADSLGEQSARKKNDLEQLRARSSRIEKNLLASEEEFEREKAAAMELESHRQEIGVFIGSLPNFLRGRKKELEQARTLFGELRSWSDRDLENARAAEEETRRQGDNARDGLAKAQERKRTLAEQLNQIGGGVCPFLKEHCRQFDPAKVEGDLEQIEHELHDHRTQLETAESRHQVARERHDTLQARKQNLGEKRKRLDELIRDFRTASSQVAPPSILQSASRISHLLEADDTRVPAPPVVPETIDTAESMEVLFEETESFHRAMQTWWEGTRPAIEQRSAKVEEVKARRQSDEQDLRNLRAQAGALEEEIAELTSRETRHRETTARATSDAEEVASEIAKLEGQLEGYSGVAKEIAAQEQLRESNLSDHESYLALKPVSDQFDSRRELLEKARIAEEQSAAGLREKETRLTEAKEGFDSSLLASAKKEYEEKTTAVVRGETDLKHAREEMEKAETKFREWEEATREKRQVESEIDRLRIASEIGELARKVLRDSAPAVAQHLCDRIAARAQRIFNQIHHDVAELRWSAERYSLRIEPGDRRFAMLSGGEQTKLALAMTLAMVHEFSSLDFCIFDEPTYAVDAESSPLLADAILEAQDAAGLEQLFLVSHDDAFEGKIENTILLEKTSAGTRVVPTY